MDGGSGMGMNAMTLFLLLAVFLMEFSDFHSMGSVPANRGGEERRAAQLVHHHERRGSHKVFGVVQSKYPFIKVNVRRVGGERLITIFTTEYRAGKTMFDVVISSGVAPSLIKSGIFAKYVSAEYKFFAAGTKDPEGYWADT